MRKVKNIEELLQALKEARPEQRNAQATVNKIMQSIEATKKGAAHESAIHLLRHASMAAAAFIIFFFLKQTWQYAPGDVHTFPNHSQQAQQAGMPRLSKPDIPDDFLSEGWKYLHEKEKKTSIKSNRLAHYIAANITLTKNIK